MRLEWPRKHGGMPAGISWPALIFDSSVFAASSVATAWTRVLHAFGCHIFADEIEVSQDVIGHIFQKRRMKWEVVVNNKVGQMAGRHCD